MASFRVETKNKVDIDKKPRVYFTCHPADFDKYFKKICEDIFKTHDCAIYYTEDMSEIIAEDEKKVDLGRNNLFVIPVTFKLLTTPNRAMDHDIPYAFKEHIPVFPFMMELGIDEFYSKPDKFGKLQYLNPCSTDRTEISYEEKLKKYLESVLISDEMAQRVRAAFDAYIFLSYRKKDRKYANELMRLIHSYPECRDIAIWFDEFLVPGESFKENIEKMLDKCDLFALLVTPHLLEKVIDDNGNQRDNYVVSTELPLARKKKEEKDTDIFAVEMESTDKKGLSAICVEDCVNAGDAAFRTRLLDAVSRMAITTNNTPEHNFLVGLAYLDGIDVEVNHTLALELITSAAEVNLPEAMLKLYNMYDQGMGVQLDYHEALKWAQVLADYYTQTCGEKHPDTLTALNRLATVYGELGDYHEEAELLKKLYALQCEVLGEKHPDTLYTFAQLATAYSKLNDHRKAAELLEKVYDLQCDTDSDTLYTLASLALAYGKLGDLRGAELSEKVYAFQYEVFGEKHPNTLTALNNLAVTYGELGDLRKAIASLEKVYPLWCEVFGEKHPHTLKVLSNLAIGYEKLGDLRKAAELLEKVYPLQCVILGKEHPDTLHTFNGLAVTCLELGEAESLKKVYTLQCEINGERHPDALSTLLVLAITYLKLGDHHKAAELLERIYTLQCEITDSYSLTILNGLARTYQELGNHHKAAELLEKVYTFQHEVLGEKHSDTLTTLNNLAETYFELGEAESLKKIYTLQREINGERHPDTLNTLLSLSITYQRLGNHRKTAELLEKAYALQREVLGEKHPNTLTTLNNLAVIYGELGIHHKAVELLEKAYALQSEIPDFDTSRTLNNLAVTYYLCGNYHKAAELFEKVYALRCEVLGAEHPATLQTHSNLEQVYAKLQEQPE